MDLDAILVSHDHPDHSSDLQNIFALRYAHRNESSNKLKIYLNSSCRYLFDAALEYYGTIIESCETLVGGKDYVLGDIAIKTFGMYHKEIYDFLGESLKTKINTKFGNSNALGFLLISKVRKS
jgi:ribonuclease BN (tRNA processing enzyme)